MNDYDLEEKEARKIPLSSIDSRDYFSNPAEFEVYRKTCSLGVGRAIDTYVQCYRLGEPFEPVQVMHDPESPQHYRLIEGRHRTSVIRAEGGVEVLAVVEEGLEVPAFLRKKKNEETT